MGKWIAAIAGVGVIALVVLIWIQLHSSTAAAVPQAIVATPPPPPRSPSPAQLAVLGAQIKQAERTPDGKLSTNSDDFFYKFSESQPKRLDAAAARCYTGGLDRVAFNAMLKLEFHDRIVNGEVTVTDVHIVESTIDNKELVDCFVREVTGTHWHDDSLPNLDDPDELVIRPERGMKKYTEENRNYEGAGPDFTNHKYQ